MFDRTFADSLFCCATLYWHNVNRMSAPNTTKEVGARAIPRRFGFPMTRCGERRTEARVFARQRDAVHLRGRRPRRQSDFTAHYADDAGARAPLPHRADICPRFNMKEVVFAAHLASADALEFVPARDLAGPRGVGSQPWRPSRRNATSSGGYRSAVASRADGLGERRAIRRGGVPSGHGAGRSIRNVGFISISRGFGVRTKSLMARGQGPGFDRRTVLALEYSSPPSAA